MRVGFAGLGKMGAVMAQLLLRGGYQLTVFNRTRTKADPLAALGAGVVDSVTELADGSDIVITMLADDTALAGLEGVAGLLTGLPAGAVHVVMGTHSAGLIRDLSQAYSDAGKFLVAAPMLGRPDVVAAHRAAIVAAGPRLALERVHPLLACIAPRIFDAGERPETAATMKIANNFLLGCAIEALGEAFALVRRWGGAPEVFREMISEGMFACAPYASYSRVIAEETYARAGFTAMLGLKDANLALAAGELAGVPLPSGEIWRDHLMDAVARGNGGHDWAVMALEQARASGLTDDVQKG